jgi:biopolymer transport protein ExbB
VATIVGLLIIGFASVVGLTLFLERLWSLRRSRVLPAALLQGVLHAAQGGRPEEARALCARKDSAAARILDVALKSRGQSRAAIKERLEEAGRKEAAELERYVPALATVGSLGPLLGLLGTVGGMILTFDAVRRSGGGDVQQLAGGIGTALTTTFAGLCVAIPAVIGHRYLLARVDDLVLELEEASLALLEVLTPPVAREQQEKAS